MLVSNENAALEDLEVVVFTSFDGCAVRLLLVMTQDKEGFLRVEPLILSPGNGVSAFWV